MDRLLLGSKEPKIIHPPYPLLWDRGSAMTDLFYGTSGPRDAQIAIVGESWGREEAAQQLPFVGESGKELTRMLSEAGIDRSTCFLTNCFAIHPKGNEAWTLFHTNQEAKELKLTAERGLFPHTATLLEIERMLQQLNTVRPQVVVACGNYALWALTERSSISGLSVAPGVTVRVPSGIMSWRGSMLYSERKEFPSTFLIPVVHPAAILRAWYNRAAFCHDLRERVPLALKSDWRADPAPTILAPPSFEQACAKLMEWLVRLRYKKIRIVADIETARGLITCIGFADGKDFAMVVPFVRLEDDKSFSSFWTADQEVVLIQLIRKLFLHRNLQLEGQNFIYDTQYIRHFLGVTPRLDFDTMLAHHLLFPGTPKGLDYLSSLYCRHHWYWKDESKEWDTKHQGFQQLLAYNAVDVLRTFECATVLRTEIEKAGLQTQWEWERKKADLALRMMLRGINVDKARRSRVGFELLSTQSAIHSTLEEIIPAGIAWDFVKTKKPWYASSKQTLHVFYDLLGLPLQRNRKTQNPTVDDEALSQLAKRAPEFQKVFNLLSSERSVGVFSSTFLSAPLDGDTRMRCSFNIAGTETFRWSSSANVFGGGTNLQNIPKGTED